MNPQRASTTIHLTAALVVIMTSSCAAEDGADGSGATCTPEVAEFSGTWNVRQSGGTTYYRHDNPESRGLVIALHGTNGSAQSVATVKREWQSFHAAAASRGYSLLVPESELRDAPRRWDNSVGANNPDTARLAELVDEAIADGVIENDDPIYVIGMSQGGGVAPIFGQVLVERGYSVRAVASYAASPNAVCEREEYTLPTTFVAMAADEIVPTAVEGIVTCAADLEARGIDAQTYVKPVESLCRERFTRIPGFDDDDSAAIVQGLVEAGVVSPEGEVLMAGTDLDDASTIPGVPLEYADFTREIDEQLQVVSAGHAFAGDRNEATLDFFADHP